MDLSDAVTGVNGANTGAVVTAIRYLRNSDTSGMGLTNASFTMRMLTTTCRNKKLDSRTIAGHTKGPRLHKLDALSLFPCFLPSLSLWLCLGLCLSLSLTLSASLSFSRRCSTDCARTSVDLQGNHVLEKRQVLKHVQFRQR